MHVLFQTTLQLLVAQRINEIYEWEIQEGCFRRIIDGRIIISNALGWSLRTDHCRSLWVASFGNTKSTFAIAQVCYLAVENNFVIHRPVEFLLVAALPRCFFVKMMP